MELDINLSFGTLDKSDYDSYSQYLSLVTEEQTRSGNSTPFILRADAVNSFYAGTGKCFYHMNDHSAPDTPVSVTLSHGDA